MCLVAGSCASLKLMAEVLLYRGAANNSVCACWKLDLWVYSMTFNM